MSRKSDLTTLHKSNFSVTKAYVKDDKILSIPPLEAGAE